MADPPKVHSTLSESESRYCSVDAAECRRDALWNDGLSSGFNCPEGSIGSNGTTNVHSLRSVYPVQDFHTAIPQPNLNRDAASLNPAWDPCRLSGFYSTPSMYSVHNQAESHLFAPRSSVTPPGRNISSASTMTQTHVSLAQSGIDPFHLRSATRTPPSSPPSSPSLAARQYDHQFPGDEPSMRSEVEESFRSITQPLPRITNPYPSRYSGIMTTRDCPLRPERECISISPDLTLTPVSENGHWAPVELNYSPNLPDRGSISDPEHHSGSRFALRRSIRGPRVQTPQITYGPLITEGGSRTSTRPHSVTRLPTLRSRRVSLVSRALSPLDVTYCPNQTGAEDGDTLPALLSPSDGSETDRSPSPDNSQDTDFDSIASSEDGRHFLHPGTPIQTELPELRSLLELYQTEGGDSNRVWVAPDDSITAEQLDFQSAQDDDDIAGDAQRAKELLDGLEQVDSKLVKRYEKVRGDGHDICTVCRDSLLHPENKHDEEEERPIDPIAVWNIVACRALPFQPPSWEPSIHAFPCTHLFHTECLVPWLCLKTTCPTCRLDIDPHSLTLRVRRWASPWPHIDTQERQYVNVDALGRRIPWTRPPAASLKEWVEGREGETPKQREERLKFHPSPRQSEPPVGSGWGRHSRRRALSEPRATDISLDPLATSLGLIISEPAEDLLSRAECLEPQCRGYGVLVSRSTTPNADTGHDVDLMAIDEPLDYETSAIGSVSCPQLDADIEVLTEATYATNNRLRPPVLTPHNSHLPSISSASTMTLSESASSPAGDTLRFELFGHTRNEFSGHFSRPFGPRDYHSRTLQPVVEVSSGVQNPHPHRVHLSSHDLSLPLSNGALRGVGSSITPFCPSVQAVRSHDVLPSALLPLSDPLPPTRYPTT